MRRWFLSRPLLWLFPATSLRIQLATSLATRWWALTVSERASRQATARWQTSEARSAWLKARRAAYRAVARNWLGRSVLDDLLQSMLPLWRRPAGFKDSALVPLEHAKDEWVVDALLATLADPRTLARELRGSMEVVEALDLLTGTWTEVLNAHEESD